MCGEEVAWDDIKPLDGHEVYKVVLKQVWLDGKTTRDEFQLVKSLQHSLGITNEEHTLLEAEVIGEEPEGTIRNLTKEKTAQYNIDWDRLEVLDPPGIYKKVMETAWRDGTLTREEMEVLCSLRRALSISPEVHDRVASELRVEKNLNPEWEARFRECFFG